MRGGERESERMCVCERMREKKIEVVTVYRKRINRKRK